MPDPDYIQPDLFSIAADVSDDRADATDRAARQAVPEIASETVPEAVPEDPEASSDRAELLDPFSLQTVLDMLTVIDSIAELELLETLTPAQKRQVWEATPEAVRGRLKQIRAGTTTSCLPDSGDEADPLLTGRFDRDSLPAEQTYQPNVALSNPQTAPPAEIPDVKIGDWVVLKANPRLTAIEMIAIWKVVELQGESARVTYKTLNRLYPIAWMLVYPKPDPDEDEPEF